MSALSLQRPAPPEIDGAKVLLCAVIAPPIQPTGRCSHLLGGALVGAAALAICCYEGEVGFYLFGCDEAWKCVTDTFHSNLDEAKQQAESEYSGVTEAWRTVPQQAARSVSATSSARGLLK